MSIAEHRGVEEGVAYAIIRMVRGETWRCGYALIPENHPWSGVSYHDIFGEVDVHGGLTYSGDLFEDGGWWIGFDTNHYNDGPATQSLAYCTEQAQSLARQVAKAGKAALPPAPTLPLAISQTTRDLARKWHEEETGTNDERFFGFMAEWVKGSLTKLEVNMSQAFLKTAAAFRVDFLIDLRWAGIPERQGKGLEPLAYWLISDMGSHLFSKGSLHHIHDLPSEKRAANLYLLAGDGLVNLGKAEDYAASVK